MWNSLIFFTVAFFLGFISKMAVWIFSALSIVVDCHKRNIPELAMKGVHIPRNPLSDAACGLGHYWLFFSPKSQ